MTLRTTLLSATLDVTYSWFESRSKVHNTTRNPMKWMLTCSRASRNAAMWMVCLCVFTECKHLQGQELLCLTGDVPRVVWYHSVAAEGLADLTLPANTHTGWENGYATMPGDEVTASGLIDSAGVAGGDRDKHRWQATKCQRSLATQIIVE